MKIVLVNSFYHPDVIGGAEVFARVLAEGLVKEGHEVHVICLGTTNTIEEFNRVKIYRFKGFKLGFPEDNSQAYFSSSKSIFVNFINDVMHVYNPINKKRIGRLIDSIKPDLIHINSFCIISPSVWKLAIKYEVPMVQTMHDSMLSHMSIFLRRENTFFMSLGSTGKIIQYFHKKLSKKLNYVTAPSEYTLNDYISSGYFKNVNYKRIYNAIDFDPLTVDQWYSQKKTNLMESDKIKFVYLSRLDNNKGLDTLISSFSAIKNDALELHVAGSGPLATHMIETCRKDRRIKFHSVVLDEKKTKLLLNCHVLIFPTKLQESFGMVVIEAYKHGMPVIASRVGGTKEIVYDKKTGILVEPGDKASLTEAINHYSIKENILKTLDNCRSTLDKFAVDRKISSYIDIYNEAVSSQRE